jgi:hypothetical protein
MQELPSAIRIDDLGMQADKFKKLSEAGQLKFLIRSLKNHPHFDTLFEPVFQAAKVSRVAPLLAKGGPERAKILEAMRHMGKIDTSLIQDKGVAKVLDQAPSLKAQYEALGSLRKNADRALRTLLKRHGVSTLDELRGKPDLHPNTLRAIRRHVVRQGAIQDAAWAIQSRIAERAGMADPKRIASLVLSEASLETIGKFEPDRVWHVSLQRILEEVNAKTGKSYTGIRDLNEAFKAATDPELKKFLQSAVTRWKQTASELVKQKIPVHYGMVGHTIFPMPPGALKEQAKEYMKRAVETGQLVPASIYEEAMLRTTPIPLFGKLLPIRHVFGDAFTNAIREATERDAVFREGFLGPKGLKKWMNMLGKNLGKGPNSKEFQEAARRIGAFLENTDVDEKVFLALGKRAVRTGKAGKAIQRFIEKYGLKSVEELKIAYEMRQAYNKIFEAAGLNPEKFLKHYMPHFRKLQGLSREKAYEYLIARKKTLGLIEREIEGILWVNELPRKYAEGTWEYEPDAFRAFVKYVTGASKKIHYDTLFDKWTDAFNKIGMDPARKNLFEDLKGAIVGRPGYLEMQTDAALRELFGVFKKEGLLGPKPTAAASAFLAELQYLGGMGANPFTVVKNLTQKILTIADVTDDGNWVEGLKWWWKWKQIRNTPLGKAIQRMNPILNDRQYLEGLHHTYSAMEGFMSRLGIAPETTRAIRDKAFALYRWSDIDNVRDAFGTKFLYVLDRGAPVQDAVEIALASTRATQFMYGIDSPLLYRSPLGKQLGIFMSWPLNWAMLLWNQGTQQDMRKAIATVGLMAIGAEGLSMTGFNFGSIHPINVARGILPIALAEGEDRWPSALRTGVATGSYLRALASGDPQAIDRAFENLKSRLAPFVPMGVMGKRMLDFIDLARNEWKSYDNRERLRWELDKDNPTGRLLGIPGEALRGLLGPTVEARRRWEDWQQIQKIDSAYRRMRRMAIEAFFDGDYQKFMRLQEQLYYNFNRQIEAKDLEYELRLRQLPSVQRQLMSLPAEIREPFLVARGIQP